MPSVIEELNNQATMNKYDAGLDLASKEDTLTSKSVEAGDDDGYGFYSESEGSFTSSESSFDEDDDSSYLSSGEEDDFIIDERPRTLMRLPHVSSEPSIRDLEMSATQVSVLLNQMRLMQQTTTTTVASDNKSKAASSVVSSKVNHIQGQAMPKMVRRNSLKSLESSVSSSTALSLETGEDQSPAELLKDILATFKIVYRSFKQNEVNDFFQDITEERLMSYSADMITAVRESDVETLRHMHEVEHRRLDSCNRFGESILHTACRRGSPEVLRYLVEEAGVDLRVRDDYGRTPLHDACWSVDPNMDLIRTLVVAWPDLLLVEDKRGHAPLEYVRGCQWTTWNQFLKENRKKLIPKVLLEPIDS